MARAGRIVTAAALAVALVGGYGAADAADLVPGVLTTGARPQPPEPFPSPTGTALEPGTSPVLADLDPQAPGPTDAGLAAALTGLLDAPELGPSVSASVVDVGTGEVLLARGADVPREPASLTKLLTGAAALHALDPAAPLLTRAVLDDQGRVVLVGGGDVLLAAGAGDPDAVAGRAGLADLADATARALAERGTASVTVGVDTGLFSGATTSPGWAPGDVSQGFVAPIEPLEVDAGSLGAGRGRDPQPATSAARTFAALLAERGLTVVGDVSPASAAADDEELAAVESAPLADVVGYALTTSDNTVAEALARLVAHERGQPASFTGGTAAVLAELRELADQVPGSGGTSLGAVLDLVTLSDGSGLGDGTRIAPATITALLTLAASEQGSRLRPLVTDLPVAGLTGTLADRFDGTATADAAGLLRAKTGTLTGVTTLGGVVQTEDGRLLAFAVMADQVPAGGTAAARQAVDAVGAAVAGCGCSG